MIYVYYDDKCPICQSEIEHFYQKFPDRISPLPISTAMDELTKAGINEIDALTYLHAKDETGKIHQGMEAVRLLYRTCESKLAVAFDLPMVYQMSNLIYPLFARHRYKIPKWISYAIFGKPQSILNTKCDNGVCHINPKDRINQ